MVLTVLEYSKNWGLYAMLKGIFIHFQYLIILFVIFLCQDFTVFLHSFCLLAGRRPIFTSRKFCALFWVIS